MPLVKTIAVGLAKGGIFGAVQRTPPKITELIAANKTTFHFI